MDGWEAVFTIFTLIILFLILFLILIITTARHLMLVSFPFSFSFPFEGVCFLLFHEAAQSMYYFLYHQVAVVSQSEVSSE